MKHFTIILLLCCMVFAPGIAMAGKSGSSGCGCGGSCGGDNPGPGPSPSPEVTVSEGSPDSGIGPDDECCRYYEDENITLVVPPECDTDLIRESCER
jgi:hypothetical protein